MIFQMQFVSLLRLLEANITDPFMEFLDSLKWLNLHFDVEVNFFSCGDEVIVWRKCFVPSNVGYLGGVWILVETLLWMNHENCLLCQHPETGTCLLVPCACCLPLT